MIAAIVTFIVNAALFVVVAAAVNLTAVLATPIGQLTVLQVVMVVAMIIYSMVVIYDGVITVVVILATLRRL